jgi:uncharacterized protein (TIGR03435 family)
MNVVGHALSASIVSAIVACSASAQAPAISQPPQNPSASRLTFEVASVKPVEPNGPHINGIDVYPGGRVVIRGTSLKWLIGIAHQVSFWQIEGGEDWMTKETYDVEAKAPEAMEPPDFNLGHNQFGIEDERLRQMLQALLTDRFALTFHSEAKTGSIYLLERSGRPIKLKSPEQVSAGAYSYPAGFGSIGWAGRWVLFNTTMPQLARFASDFYLHRPVIDKTGLVGAFDFKSAQDDSIPGVGEPPDSFVNMIQEIGLKLTPAKGAADMFVIDQAQRPSPN